MLARTIRSGLPASHFDKAKRLPETENSMSVMGTGPLIERGEAA